MGLRTVHLAVAGLLSLMVSAPVLHGQAAVAADPFPAVDPKFFTASTPSVETVISFLKGLWGYDTNRLFKVMAVQSTAVAGVSKITVFLTDACP